MSSRVVRLVKVVSALQQADNFENPDIRFEQYATTPEIAGNMLHMMERDYGDVKEKEICDLGSGCGMLSLAACMLGCARVVGLEVDGDAIAIWKRNATDFGFEDKMEVMHVDLVDYAGLVGVADEKSQSLLKALADGDRDDEGRESVSTSQRRGGRRGGYRGGRGRGSRGRGRGQARNNKKNSANRNQCVEGRLPESPILEEMPGRGSFDVVITNPPFGTRVNGIDMLFVKMGLYLARKAVYSLHKTASREFILKTAKGWGVDAKVIATVKYNLDRSYHFHKEESRDIEVDFIRFWPINTVVQSPETKLS